jgi:uncharacterized protein (TIGR02186 family)
MRNRAIIIAFVAVAVGGAAAPACAERLVVSLSNHRVAVTSNFVGENLVLFGTIEPDRPRAALRDSYDLVVTVTGPRETLRTRRKERVLGIWVNIDSREFVRVPSYLEILSNRPVGQIAPPEMLRQLQLGLNHITLTQRIGADFADTVPDDPFRVAFIKLETQSGAYREAATAVTFLTPTVFRAAIPLAADAPTGSYSIDVKLFADGKLAASTTSALEVIKAGFEQFVADAAQNYGLLYGIVASMMALLIGWFGSVVFRRD